MAGRLTQRDRRAFAFYEARDLLQEAGIDPLHTPPHLWHNALDFASRKGQLGCIADNWFSTLNDHQWRLFRVELIRYQNGEER